MTEKDKNDIHDMATLIIAALCVPQLARKHEDLEIASYNSFEIAERFVEEAARRGLDPAAIVERLTSKAAL